MMDIETEHFKHWLSHEIDLAHRDLKSNWKAIDAKAAAEGWYKSGRRIKECVKSIADVVGHLAKEAFQKSSTAQSALEHHNLVGEVLSNFLKEWASKIPTVVQSTGSPWPRLDQAVDALLDQIGLDLNTATELSRLSILSAQQTKIAQPSDKSKESSAKQPARAMFIRRRPAAEALAEIIATEWPDGFRSNLKAPDRNKRINEISKSKGGSGYSARTIVRAINLYNARAK